MEEVSEKDERRIKEILMIEVLRELGEEMPMDGYFGNISSSKNKKARVCVDARYDYLKRCYQVKKILDKI